MDAKVSGAGKESNLFVCESKHFISFQRIVKALEKL